MPSVLFVCTANICRSPMAEALFKRKLAQENNPESWLIQSAGTWANNGDPAIEDVVCIMEEQGINVRSHSARRVTADLLQSFNLILVMTRNHKEALKAEFPEIAGRLYLLSEMAGPGYDIYDPIGGPMDEYRQTANELDELISQGYERICQLAEGIEPEE